MKLFLRYQLTGTVFIGWFVVFYYASQSKDLHTLVMEISKLDTNRTFLTVFTAYPVGVLIHQLSVLIKNFFVVKCCPAFSDAPIVFYGSKTHCPNSENTKYKNEVEVHSELVKYYLDKVSNLNTFYYVRFDNAFLSPFLALISFCIVFDFSTSDHVFLELLLFAVLIFLVTLIYIPRLAGEINNYLYKLEELGFKSEKKNNSDFCYIDILILILMSFLLFLVICLVKVCSRC